jgi:predicted nucleic acid-binding protein
MLIVSDASPLIALDEAGHLNILQIAFGEILIPEEVFLEVFGTRRQRAKPSWIKVRSLTDPTGLATFSELRNSLDKGESGAIALASVLKARVLIDEQLGSNECKRRGIECITTAQVVEMLRANGTISKKNWPNIVSSLRMHGVYVDPGAA